jgi:hypothetical protein
MHAPLLNEQDHSTKLANPATLQLKIQKTTTDDDTLTPYYCVSCKSNKAYINRISITHPAKSPKKQAKAVTGAVDQWKDKQIISTQITEGMQKAIGLAKASESLRVLRPYWPDVHVRTGEFCRWAASAGAACTVSASNCIPGRQSFVSCKSKSETNPIDQISTQDS